LKVDHCQPEEEETCIITAPAPSRERERRTPEGEEKRFPKGLRKDKERKREDKEREEVKEGERTTERDRERPGGQGKRDSVSDGADLRLLREWGREQDRARVSTWKKMLRGRTMTN
jgi:hypothetical protein